MGNASGRTLYDAVVGGKTSDVIGVLSQGGAVNWIGGIDGKRGLCDYVFLFICILNTMIVFRSLFPPKKKEKVLCFINNTWTCDLNVSAVTYATQAASNNKPCSSSAMSLSKLLSRGI